MQIPNLEGWTDTKKILVMLAHPDDPEFFLGGTIAHWTTDGHRVEYCLFTRGDKGVDKEATDPNALKSKREEEQRAAAKELGVDSVEFLNYEDGYLTAEIDARKTAVAVIRRKKPDIVVTCDPQNYYHQGNRVNHPDHRAAGQIVIDAVFPAAGNPMFFPELIDMGLESHKVAELWISAPYPANFVVDISAFWERRYKALLNHFSQIHDPENFRTYLFSRRAADSTEESPRFEEHFRRIVF
ncbi:MAG TPA: PIG-L family deacetylase [Bellilinea sp.]|nr:PIG-L family deacetylase [Bellilinea sp.]